MKRVLILFAFVAGIAAPSFAQDTCARAQEAGFSYCPPAGWTIRQNAEDKYKLFLAPSVPDFTPNINVKDEESKASLEDHVALNIRNILANPGTAGAKSITVLEQAYFTTDTGERLIRVKMRVEAGPLVVRANQYYFKGRGLTYYVMSCLSLESAANTYEPMFDRTLRTLRVDH